MSSIPTGWQQQIAERSEYRCSYCQSQQRLMGVSLTIDHVIPQALGGLTELDNLCLACWDCNLIKGDRTSSISPETGAPVRLFHPNQQKWLDHFRWSADGSHIIGVTAVGQATVIALKLNRSQLVESRRYWVKAGWHPPVID
jgi:hypothetical protein